ncbi:class I SAM-dependent methyltransferase family protein [Lyngbya confervoides]|uniref:Class I SAM-dependent methyltransferase family protein n=1 Tax=Lyngbya confervoides BDU141951 TaxID=1574623 RepID=A0ABD4T590_9CYAN|nr:class I SAM-dependent methyltransferase family protein [Lyngbya confervoides]MCM1983689.1 class I SAM-dependent methyltransferase family protein [Lyngbya confervoides BDU141951]
MTVPTNSEATLFRPLPVWHPKALYYGIFRLLLRSVGRLSKGIRLGLNYGFDSGVMLEYVYGNRAQGTTFVGRGLDRLYLNSVGWKGIRERGQILQQVLRETLDQNRAQQIHSYLLDVACGGGRYDLEVLAQCPADSFSATLRDYRRENIEKATQLAQQLGVSVTLEQADAFSDVALAQVQPAPNIIVVSGLHEILPDNDLICHHFRQLYEIMAPQGTLIYTIQPHHPQLELIARTLNSHTGKPWVMRLRSLELTQEWARAAGFETFEVHQGCYGIFGVVKTYKNATQVH